MLNIPPHHYRITPSRSGKALPWLRTYLVTNPPFLHDSPFPGGVDSRRCCREVGVGYFHYSETLDQYSSFPHGLYSEWQDEGYQFDEKTQLLSVISRLFSMARWMPSFQSAPHQHLNTHDRAKWATHFNS